MSVFEDAPAIVQELVDIIGEAATLQLLKAYGGSRVYIPASCGEDHWLPKAIGSGPAHELCSYYRVGPSNRPVGVQLELPHWQFSTLEQARRGAHKAARTALDAGASTDEAARRSGLSRRVVQRMKSANQTPASEPPLLAMMLDRGKPT